MSDGYDERMRRWRLVLGEGGMKLPLSGADAGVAAALGALYDRDGDGGGQGGPGGGGGRDGQPGTSRRGGLGASAPRVARWLGDIRTYFPASVVQVMQKDAI